METGWKEGKERIVGTLGKTRNSAEENTKINPTRLPKSLQSR